MTKLDLWVLKRNRRKMQGEGGLTRTGEAHAFLPHVQGLRAIAVLTVLIHHIKADYLPGGFIGVDIFFVLSGYLITSHIQTQRAAKVFSLRDFYFRRIRRIIPNQILVIFAVIIAAYLLLDSGTFEQTSASGAYSALMMANVFFLGNSGYFAPAAETMPLLHMWSLAVEEQFYLIWPCTLIILSSINSNIRPWAVALSALAILAITELAIDYYPTAAFYMMPFRIVEFLFGALLVLWRPRKFVWADVVALFALSVIAACLFLYSSVTRFPGVAALIPCVATAAVIALGNGAVVQRLLGNRLAIAIGDRSYAMYLVHWPVIVFLKASNPALGPAASVVLILVMTFALTEVLYQAWEKPLRYVSLSTSRAKVAYASGVVSASCLIALAGAYIGKDHTAGEMQAVLKPSLSGCKDPEQTELSACVADVLIIGDSHSGHMQHFYSLASNGTVARSWFLGCPPIFGAYKIYNERSDAWKTEICRQLIEQWEEEIPKAKASTVILTARWAWLYSGGDYGGQWVRQDWLVTSESSPQTTEFSRQVLRQRLDFTIRTLLEAGKKVVLIGQVPLRTDSEISCAKSNAGKPDVDDICRALSKDVVLMRLSFMDETIRDLKKKYPDIETVIPSEVFCRDECVFTADGELLYRDSNHLNNIGAQWFAANFDPHGFDPN